MADLFHIFGNDLVVSATGDLAIAQDSQEGQQRVFRRLLTNPTDYLWSQAYGAGLPSFVGQPANPAVIEAITLANMENEAVVSQNPPPSVTVTSDNHGTVVLTVLYTDQYQQTNELSFPMADN